MILTRWPGKPTSGRYVYASRDDSGGQVHGWQWQCDLCDDSEDPRTYGYAPTMRLAFAGAMGHAVACGRSNVEVMGDCPCTTGYGLACDGCEAAGNVEVGGQSAG